MRRSCALLLSLAALSACDDFRTAWQLQPLPETPAQTAEAPAPAPAAETAATPAALTEADIEALVATAPVGKTMALPGDDALRIAVIEEYDAATGERCRRYARYANETERGTLHTACQIGAEGTSTPTTQWVSLRPLTHATLAPLADAPAYSTASTFGSTPTTETAQ